VSQEAQTSLDQVCGAQVRVEGSAHVLRLRHIDYHFCSAQCLACFEEIPELYTRGQRLDQIQPMLQRRRLRFAGADDSALGALQETLSALGGMVEVQRQGQGLVVRYDLRRLRLHQIETACASAGQPLRGGWYGWLRGFWRFGEQNELSNGAQAGAGPCCNRPPTKLH